MSCAEIEHPVQVLQFLQRPGYNFSMVFWNKTLIIQHPVTSQKVQREFITIISYKILPPLHDWWNKKTGKSVLLQQEKISGYFYPELVYKGCHLCRKAAQLLNWFYYLLKHYIRNIFSLWAKDIKFAVISNPAVGTQHKTWFAGWETNHSWR